MNNAPRMIRYAEADPPSRDELIGRLRAEGLDWYPWSNGPHDVYDTHTHPFDKVLYVLDGSITFILPEGNLQFSLHPGDRLDLPAGTVHSAVVGPRGVTCLEGHRID